MFGPWGMMGMPPMMGGMPMMAPTPGVIPGMPGMGFYNSLPGRFGRDMLGRGGHRFSGERNMLMSL